MISLDRDPDLKTARIEEVHIRAKGVLVSYYGRPLPTLFLYEEGDRDKLIKMFRSVLNKED